MFVITMLRNVQVCIVCMYVCMCVYVYMYVCVYVYVCVCVGDGVVVYSTHCLPSTRLI